MRAMILAAGVGSRLEPLTCNVPKPLVPIVNRPAMEHIISLLAHYGIREIAANLWYKAEQIEGYFRRGEDWGVELIYSREKELLGTAGGVKKMADFLGHGTFLVISGDALTDINLEEMLAFHRRKQALATIALQEVEDPTHFGVVVCDGEGLITGFQEKPLWHEAKSRLVNTGIYIFEPEILDLIPAETFYDFGRNLFPELVRIGAPFYGYRMEGYWCDIGTLTQYRLAHYDVLQGRVRLYTQGLQLPTPEQPIIVGKGSQIHPTAQLEGLIVLGEGCTIGKGARLRGEVVVGDGCVIEAGAVIERSVLWKKTYVGSLAHLTECVVGSECALREHARLWPGVILSDTCVVEAYGEVAANSLHWPGEVVKVAVEP